MEKILINNSTYQVFKITKEQNFSLIDIIWGKHDFKCKVIQSGSSLKLDEFKIKFNNQWYNYIKVSGHGFSMEETQWGNNGKEEFIELPKNFKSNIFDVCTQALEENR